MYTAKEIHPDQEDSVVIERVEQDAGHGRI